MKEASSRDFLKFTSHEYFGAPNELQLPDEIHKTALDLLEQTLKDGHEYGTSFTWKKNKFKNGKIARGTLNSVRPAGFLRRTRTFLRDESGITIHTHPSAGSVPSSADLHYFLNGSFPYELIISEGGISLLSRKKHSAIEHDFMSLSEKQINILLEYYANEVNDPKKEYSEYGQLELISTMLWRDGQIFHNSNLSDPTLSIVPFDLGSDFFKNLPQVSTKADRLVNDMMRIGSLLDL